MRFFAFAYTIRPHLIDLNAAARQTAKYRVLILQPKRADFAKKPHDGFLSDARHSYPERIEEPSIRQRITSQRSVEERRFMLIIMLERNMHLERLFLAVIRA
jgi:hypothetical protein